jgi:hypothetical protein
MPISFTHEEATAMRVMTRMMTAAILGAGLALSAPAMAQDGAKPDATMVDWRHRGYYAPPPAYYAPPPGYYYAPRPRPRPRYYAPPPVYYYAPPPRPRYYAPPPPGVSLHFRF